MQKTKIEWRDKCWYPIPDRDGYYASMDGEIMSTKSGEPIIMKQIESADGHRYVFTYSNGVMKKVWVHRAVLSASSGRDEPGLICRHFDDDPSNNCIENLVWGTAKDNADDKIRNKRTANGEKAGAHKLNEKQVMEIRNRYAEGERSISLAEEYHISKGQVLAIVRGDKWKHLPTVPIKVKHTSKRLTPLSQEQIKIGTEALNRYAASIRKERKEVPCACGCGQMIISVDNHGRDRKYAHGHNRKR